MANQPVDDAPVSSRTRFAHRRLPVGYVDRAKQVARANRPRRARAEMIAPARGATPTPGQVAAVRRMAFRFLQRHQQRVAKEDQERWDRFFNRQWYDARLEQRLREARERRNEKMVAARLLMKVEDAE